MLSWHRSHLLIGRPEEPSLLEDAYLSCCTEIGRWWNGSEVDVMAVDAGMRHALIGECKFKNSPVGFDVLKKLQQKGDDLKPPVEGYYLFSRSGFTSGLREQASSLSDVHLVPCDKLYEQ